MSQIRNIVLLLALTLGAVIYLTADAEQEPTTALRTSLKRVKVTAVEHITEAQELRFSGVTRAARRARLAFSVGGRLLTRPVEVGDQVSRGQIIAQINTQELENSLATARATVAELAARRSQTERDLERTEQLVAAKAATAEELERVQAGRDALRATEEAARARLKEGERLLSEGTLRAPFAGTVTEVFYEPGEVATPGMPVAMLSGSGEVELEVEVPEMVIPRIQQGDTVHLELPVLGDTTLVGEVKSVGRTAAGPGRLFPVVVTVPPNPQLIAGASAELVLLLENDNALSLPVEAVINPGGQQPAVFKVVESDGAAHAHKVAVEVGTLLGHRVTVVGDLAAGDLVVVGGQRGLLAGEAVEIDR